MSNGGFHFRHISFDNKHIKPEECSRRTHTHERIARWQIAQLKRVAEREAGKGDERSQQVGWCVDVREAPWASWLWLGLSDAPTVVWLAVA